MKHKKEKKVEKKSYDISLIIPIFAILLFSVMFYLYTKDIWITLFLIISLFITLLLSKSGNKPKEDDKLITDMISFYQNFISFSGINLSYHTGFISAVGALPISKMKESLQDYIDSSFAGDIPLFLKDSRDEMSLSSSIKLLLRDDEEYERYTIDAIKKKFNRLKNNKAIEDDRINPLIITSIVAILFIAVVAYLTIPNV